ncbi:MAG: ABC transporter permease [Mesorhizobium sp.]|nr:MAG: ABC transporter permease [Mesorhizobium sp.]
MTNPIAPELSTAGRMPAKPRAGVWRRLLKRPLALLGLGIIALVLAGAILAPWLTGYDPNEQMFDGLTLEGAPLPPGAQFWLGTDLLGRDLLTRLLFGARTSLIIGIVANGVALLIGTLVGITAGYFRGWVDTLIMRIMDIILAFPSLLLALVLVAILGPGLFNAMLAIALVLQPHFARLTRAAVMAEKNREYVISAKVAGAGHLRLMVRTILPNCLAPLIVQATLSFSNAILEAAALGFLGVGAQPPTPEWGTMLASAREFILRAPWVVTFPGLAILITVLAINLIGDGLRDAFDPKLKRS